MNKQHIFFWDTTVNPVDYPKEIKDKFFELNIKYRKKFIIWFGKISKKYHNNLDWWIKIPATRDPFKSQLYRNIIILEILKNKKFNQKIQKIVVDSSSLKRTISMNKIFKKNKTNINIKKKNSFIYYNVLKSIFFSLITYLLVRIFSKKKELSKFLGITLIDTFIDYRSSETDFIYPNLNKIIKKNKLKEIFFVPNFLENKNIYNLFRNIKLMSKKNYIFKENYLNLKDFLFCIFETVFSKKNKDNFLKYDNVDYSLILREELNSKKEFYSEFQSRLNFLFIKKLKKNKIRVKKAINRFENQSVDKAWNHGFRTFYPKAETLGYQGFLYFPHMPNQTPALYEEQAKIIPKKIVVTGKIFKKPRLEFCKKTDVIIGPSLGKQDIFKKIEKKYDYKFVLALCGFRALDEKLLEWSFHALKNNKNLKIIIKPHPILPLSKMKNYYPGKFKDQIIISNENVQLLLKKTEVLISSGPTSIILESLVYGCKLFYLVLDPSDLLILKKISIPKFYFKFISNKNDLLKNMNLLSKKKFVKVDNNLRSSFYTKLNKNNMRIFF